MSEESKCPRCGAIGLSNRNTAGVYSCGTESWPRCSDVRESAQCLRNQIAKYAALLEKIKLTRAEWAEARADFAKGLTTKTGEAKAECSGWWDACCCVVQDLEALLEK